MAVETDPPLEILRKALKIAQQMGDYRFSGDVAVSIALYLMKEKKFSLAERLLKMAREFYQLDKRPDALKHSRVRLIEAQGVLAWQRGNKKRAREILHRARYHALADHSYLLFRVDQSLSHLLEEEGQLKDSLLYAKEAYNAAAASGFHRDRALGLQRLYELYRALGKMEEAYLALEAALVVARRLRDTEMIQKLLDLRKKLLQVYTPEEKPEAPRGESPSPQPAA